MRRRWGKASSRTARQWCFGWRRKLSRPKRLLRRRWVTMSTRGRARLTAAAAARVRPKCAQGGRDWCRESPQYCARVRLREEVSGRWTAWGSGRAAKEATGGRTTAGEEGGNRAAREGPSRDSCEGVRRPSCAAPVEEGLRKGGRRTLALYWSLPGRERAGAETADSSTSKTGTRCDSCTTGTCEMSRRTSATIGWASRTSTIAEAR